MCFDLSVLDIFGTIKVGAKLVPIPENFFGNGALLIDFIAKKAITIIYTVPSSILAFLSEKTSKKIAESSLRHIIFAGEQLYSKNLHPLFNILPSNCKIHNWYGPTETNVCTYFEVTEKSLINKSIIPIGIPCDYSEAHIDKNNVLHIRSNSLMTSYWNQQKQNSWYCTGDIVSQDEFGHLFFEGRADRQIKYNGYRIQPEEIENIITSVFPVKEAAVVIKDLEIILFISHDCKSIKAESILSNCNLYLEKIYDSKSYCTTTRPA